MALIWKRLLRRWTELREQGECLNWCHCRPAYKFLIYLLSELDNDNKHATPSAISCKNVLCSLCKYHTLKACLWYKVLCLPNLILISNVFSQHLMFSFKHHCAVIVHQTLLMCDVSRELLTLIFVWFLDAHLKVDLFLLISLLDFLKVSLMKLMAEPLTLWYTLIWKLLSKLIVYLNVRRKGKYLWDQQVSS